MKFKHLKKLSNQLIANFDYIFSLSDDDWARLDNDKAVMLDYLAVALTNYFEAKGKKYTFQAWQIEGIGLTED